MVILRKLYSQPLGQGGNGKDMKRNLEEAKRDSTKMLQGLQKNGLDPYATSSLRPAVVSDWDMSGKFSNGKEVDSPANPKDDTVFSNEVDEDTPYSIYDKN